MSSSTGNTERVSAYESTIQLPTYLIRGENRNPVFRSQYGVAHIYPYTLLDDISPTPSEKNYHTLNIENRYLRVTVLPELGGRVYSLYDKISGREVFYKNKVVKFSPLAIRGAFFSGGLEFSFPVAHAPTTADSVNWEIHQNEDGSASISFGGLEHISRLRWMITITLFPDRCALAQDVQLYNPYTLPGRYHYWTNASLDADEHTEFVYPLRRVRSYEFQGSASWPVARLDLIQKDPGLPGMEGVPMWPADRMQAPVNFRWQENMLAQVSIFGRDVSWDFFGAWQHTSNVGYAHFANHKDVAGMKLWSWGNAGVGVVNQTALTDDGSVYAETQCGAMETQLDFAFLQPGVTRTWREWWIPLRGMGGLTCASALAGARVKLAPAGEAGKVNLVLGVCPAKDLGQASLRVFILGKTILNETANLSPEQPWVGTYTLSAKELAGHPISILVTSEAGEDVLDYTLDRDPSPIVQDASTPASPVQAAQEYYQLGLKHENLDNREQAMDAYYKAIEASAEHGKAYYRLGLMLLRSGSLPEAKELFQKAVARNQLDGNFYLALVNRLEERPQAARGWLRAVPTSSPLYAAALSCQGMLAMSEKDWQKSINLFDQASRIEHHSISATLLLGMAMRRAGLLPAARSKLTWVLSVDPLNHCALREMAQLEPQGKYQEILSRLLADDRQYQIDLACTYLGAGLSEEALDILQEAYQSWSYPMLAYLSAYIEDNRGHASQAADWLAKAGEASPEYVFPSRIEEYLALKCALERNPRDVKAKYYQGNFLYAHQRFEEGVRLWQEALPGMAKFDVIYRNLALAAWLRENNLAEAVGLLEQCLALNPQNQDIYLHLDELYKALGLGEQREQLLHKINALPEPREDVRKRSILILVDRGDYEGALKIMLSTKFVPLEMDQSFHEVYVRGLLQRAEARLQSGDVDDAISDYQKALEFPENLGVGMPTTLAQAHIYYRLGLAYEQLGRFGDALDAWRSAALEHHPRGSALYGDVQQALDKLSRYSELGLEIKD